MAQGQRWAAMGEDKLPLPVPAQVTLGQAAPAQLCWHTGVVALEGRMPTWLNTRAGIALPTLLQYGHDRHKHSPWCCSQTPALSQPQAQHLQQH